MTNKIIGTLSGSFPTANFWQSDAERLYATCGNSFFRSLDSGKTWSLILQLPSSSGPMGILPTGFCMIDSTLYLGEYPLNVSVQPSLLRSTDCGDTWSIVASPDARHIHSIKLDPFTGHLWITTGDLDDESMIARLSDEGLDVIGGGEQLWRAVEIEFTPNAVLWGMDCPYAEQNYIVRLPRDEIGADEPTVEIVHSVSSPIYYADSVQIDGEYHVFFSTAIEPATMPEHSALVLHGSTYDGFKVWKTLAEYSRSTPILDRYFNTNAYIFIASDENRGLFFNPYNTGSDHGRIKNIPIKRLRNNLG